MTNPTVALCGKPQQMTNSNGKAKGLEMVLLEQGINCKNTEGKKLKAKCKPVCPIKNNDCCLAHLLSNQDGFMNQVSMLEELVKCRGHESQSSTASLTQLRCTGAVLSEDPGRNTSGCFLMQRQLSPNGLMPVPSKSFRGSSTVRAGGSTHIGGGLQEPQLSGLSGTSPLEHITGPGPSGVATYFSPAVDQWYQVQAHE
ncbi:hypothetical protein BDV98DRAFT_594359 [Pterulicium gracile]|uniref:Uncharacterized protein n=1 Tax=Pterulicium gracile TaxID=1884261 RepID=A0A5C3QDP2_9AGAR|nr:hypothetical protein BDV98DRAFT_594359 [Pterula gracilis]